MYSERYFSLNFGRICLNRDFVSEADAVERLVFDCDGVLIDTRNSYRKTIKQTLSLIFKPFPQKKFVGYREIEKLKFTGVYNNDWDSTYSLALFLFTTLSREGAKMLIQWLKLGNVKRVEGEAEGLKRGFENFLKSLKADPIRDPEEYATRVCELKGTSNELKEFIDLIGRPSNVRESFLAKAFDAIYYGERLFKQVYGIPPPIRVREGNIELERLYVSKSALSTLKKAFDSRMHLLTGRSRISVKYKIKDLEKYFNLENSFFIEDIVREGLGDANEFKKPSPKPLLILSNSQPTLYVGDSAEDMLLAKRAKELARNIYFAAVIGSNDVGRRRYFMESGADIILSSVNELPKVFKNRVGD